MSVFPKVLIVTTLVLAAWSPASHAGPAEAAVVVPEPCLADWSDAAPIVARERLLSARDIREQSRRRNVGDIVRITLCRAGESYVYRLVLRDAQGRISTQTIDAHAQAAQ